MLQFLISLYTVLILFFGGLPVYFLLFNENEEKLGSSALIPIIGFCTLTAFARLIVGFGIPVKYFSFILIGILVFISFILLIKKRYLINLNKQFIIGACIVLFVSSIGFWISNPDVSSFLAWDDYLYASHAQMIAEYPVTTAFDSISLKPYLAIVTDEDIKWNYLRLTLATIQSLVSTTLKVDPAYTNRLLGIIAALLTYCSAWYAGEKFKFSSKEILSFSVCSGIAPGVLAFGYEGFQGAVLLAPFLFLWHFTAYEAISKHRKRDYILCGLIFSAATTIFTEVTISFILIVIVLCIFEFLLYQNNARPLKSAFITLILGLIFNFQYIVNVYYHETYTALRYFGNNNFDGIYPYASTITGIQRNLFGTIENSIFGILSFIIFICALAGAIIHILDKKNVTCIAIMGTIFSAFYFISTSNMRVFNFYRIFTMSTSTILFCFWLFLSKLDIFIDSINGNGALALKSFKTITKKLINFLLLLFIINAGIASVYFGINIQTLPISNSDKQTYYYVGVNKRFKTKREYTEFVSQLEKIRTTKKDTILFSSDMSSLNLWTLSYFSKDKDVYFWQEDLDERYHKMVSIDSYNNFGELVNDLPDVQIINLKDESSVCSYNISPDKFSDEIAINVKTQNGKKTFAALEGPYEYKYENEYLIDIFSKNENYANFEVVMYYDEDLGEVDSVFMYLDNLPYLMTRGNGNFYSVKIDTPKYLNKGINSYKISFANIDSNGIKPLVTCVTNFNVTIN